MSSSAQPARVVRFGIFEADLIAGELRKRGRKVELQDQPFHVLALLLQRPGELVTREELRQALWAADTFVEFDESLNKAVQKLRQALGDSAENPHFIETLPRKGYRFIASIERGDEDKNERDGKRHWLLAAIGLVTIVAAGAAWFWNKPTKTLDAELVPVPLTSDPGEESCPSFSPDGTQVAYQRCPEGPEKNCDIYIKQIGVEEPFHLTENPANEYSPAWSPDGQTIAFLRDVSSGRVALVLVPHRRGPERVLAEFDEFRARNELAGPYLAWTPDSKWVVSVGLEGNLLGAALYLVSVETGKKQRLTTSPSPNRVGGDTCPAFSPDGRGLVFTRMGVSRTDLCLLRVAEGYEPQGEPEPIALDNPWNSGAVWTQDGSEIVFASGRGEFVLGPGKGRSIGLWRMAVSKSAKPRRLAFASDQAVTPSVSPRGNRLAYVSYRYDTNIWRVELEGLSRKPGIPVKLIASTRTESHPAYSPDGKRIAFLSDRSGTVEIWMCESDGSNPLQLTSLRGTLSGVRWSPDGQNIGFRVYPAGNEDIYFISVKGGAPRRLTTHPAADKWPYWSRDGQWIYFCSLRTGEPGQIWKMPSSGGEAVQVTRNGGDFPQESPDGKFVYYEKGWPSQSSVWRVPVEGGEETKVLDSVNPAGKWAVGRDGIYFFALSGERGHTDIQLYEFATGRTTKILTVESAVNPHIAVSPDGRTILYTQLDEAGSDLMLVENFR